jgi:hypothetical protein
MYVRVCTCVYVKTAARTACSQNALAGKERHLCVHVCAYVRVCV